MQAIFQNMGLLIEGVLIFGGMLAFGCWQLWELKKLKREREEREKEE